MTAITVTEEGTAMTVRSWLRPPRMSARKIGGRIEGPTGNKTAVRTVRPTAVKIGNGTGGKIAVKIGNLTDEKIDERIASSIVVRTVVKIDRLTAVKIAGRMQGANFGASIELIMWPVSMVGKGETTLVRSKWIARTGRKEWTVLTNSTSRRDRTDPRGLTGRIVQIVWNDRNVRIDLTGRSVQSVRNGQNGRINRSGPAGTNRAGVLYWKMIGSRVS
ncbi:MAG: hypothetical protein OEV17_01840 [Nitrospira sp.]|nr:hypothetical protein [Nitrospira sp.]